MGNTRHTPSATDSICKVAPVVKTLSGLNKLKSAGVVVLVFGRPAPRGARSQFLDLAICDDSETRVRRNIRERLKESPALPETGKTGEVVGHQFSIFSKSVG